MKSCKLMLVDIKVKASELITLHCLSVCAVWILMMFVFPT